MGIPIIFILEENTIHLPAIEELFLIKVFQIGNRVN